MNDIELNKDKISTSEVKENIAKSPVDDRTVFKIDKKIIENEIRVTDNKIEEERSELEKKFATQRVASIRAELDRTNIKELEFEKQKEAWKQEIQEKEQALLRKYESKMAALEENKDNNEEKEKTSTESNQINSKKKKKKKHGLLLEFSECWLFWEF